MLRCSILPAVLLMLTAATAAAQKTPTSVHGSPVVITTLERNKIKGELIAFKPDTLWIFTGERLIAMPFRYTRRIDIRRHRASPGKFALISTIGGLTSATALTAACTTVSDGCAGVFVSVGLVWGIGTIAVTHEIGRATRLRLRPPYLLSDLAAHTRYPQGFPATYPIPIAEIPSR